MNERELQINKIAQGLTTLADGITWFQDSQIEYRRKILAALDMCLYQAHPSSEEIEEGINASGLKETYTPCVIMRTNQLNEARKKIRGLPEKEWTKSFVLCLTIFRIADKRRRETQCKGGCTHEWHNIGGL